MYILKRVNHKRTRCNVLLTNNRCAFVIVKRRFNFVDNITMKIDLVKQNEKPNGSELKGTDNV